MSIFPLAIAGAVIGGGLRFGQARARNRAIERAALTSQRRINKLMAQVRMDSAISTEQLSRNAQRALGGALNMSPERQLGADKSNVATEATNNSQNLLLAAAGGALEGAQGGLSLGSAISEAQTQARTADLAKQQGECGLATSQVQLSTARMDARFAFNRLNNQRRLTGGARRSVGTVGNVVQFR